MDSMHTLSATDKRAYDAHYRKPVKLDHNGAKYSRQTLKRFDEFLNVSNDLYWRIYKDCIHRAPNRLTDRGCDGRATAHKPPHPTSPHLQAGDDKIFRREQCERRKLYF